MAIRHKDTNLMDIDVEEPSISQVPLISEIILLNISLLSDKELTNSLKGLVLKLQGNGYVYSKERIDKSNNKSYVFNNTEFILDNGSISYILYKKSYFTTYKVIEKTLY